MQYKWKALLIVGVTVFPMLALAAPPKHRISMQQAVAKVRKVQPGVIKEKELEHENGRWIYSFDILAKDHQIHEVHVDPKTGKVLSRSIESAAHERAETHSEMD